MGPSAFSKTIRLSQYQVAAPIEASPTAWALSHLRLGTKRKLGLAHWRLGGKGKLRQLRTGRWALVHFLKQSSFPNTKLRPSYGAWALAHLPPGAQGKLGLTHWRRGANGKLRQLRARRRALVHSLKPSNFPNTKLRFP